MDFNTEALAAHNERLRNDLLEKYNLENQSKRMYHLFKNECLLNYTDFNSTENFKQYLKNNKIDLWYCVKLKIYEMYFKK